MLLTAGTTARFKTPPTVPLTVPKAPSTVGTTSRLPTVLVTVERTSRLAACCSASRPLRMSMAFLMVSSLLTLPSSAIARLTGTSTLGRPPVRPPVRPLTRPPTTGTSGRARLTGTSTLGRPPVRPPTTGTSGRAGSPTSGTALPTTGSEPRGALAARAAKLAMMAAEVRILIRIMKES
jgi:hypothetical protein